MHTSLTLLREGVHEYPGSAGPGVTQASPHDVIGVGIAFSAAGLYVMLGAAGYVPMPESNSPAFIGFCAGAAFLFAGLTCMVRARAGMLNMESEVPDSAPRWTQISYRVLAIGAAGALATIGTYVAIGRAPARSACRRRSSRCRPPEKSSAAPCSGSAR